MKTKSQLLHEYFNGCGTSGGGTQEIGAGGGGEVFALPDGRVVVARAEGSDVAPKLYTQADLDAAVAAERSACAGYAECYDLGTPEGHEIAKAIRARTTP